MNIQILNKIKNIIKLLHLLLLKFTPKMSDQQIKKQQMDKNINDGNYDMYFMHFMLQTIITNQNTMKDDL